LVIIFNSGRTNLNLHAFWICSIALTSDFSFIVPLIASESLPRRDIFASWSCVVGHDVYSQGLEVVVAAMYVEQIRSWSHIIEEELV
jgi:hypothetical protein